jgi:hypothetical protein
MFNQDNSNQSAGWFRVFWLIMMVMILLLSVPLLDNISNEGNGSAIAWSIAVFFLLMPLLFRLFFYIMVFWPIILIVIGLILVNAYKLI